MFRRTNLPSIFYFLRLAFLFSYIQWLMSEAQAQPQDNRARIAASMSLEPNWAHIYYDYTVVNADYTLTEVQKKIRELIMFDFTTKLSLDQQKINTDFLSNILFSMYQSNPLDHCKLDFLIKYNPGFYILASDKFTHPASKFNADYSPDKNILSLNDLDTRRHANGYKQTFSHVLRHAVDSLNNFKNGFCLHKGYPRSYIHGDAAVGSCELSSPDARRVYKLVSDDLADMMRLFASNSLAAAFRTPEQSAQLSQLGALLSKYMYQPTTFSAFDTNINLERVSKTYVFNTATFTYQLANSKNVVTQTIQIDMLSNHSPYLTKYLLEFNPFLNEATWGFSEPFNTSEANLISDVINNIIVRIYMLKLHYTEAGLSYKTGPNLDEVLSPYSRPVVFNGNVTSLRNWLFPRLSAHEKSRYSKEFNDCLEHEESTALTRSMYPNAF